MRSTLLIACLAAAVVAQEEAAAPQEETVQVRLRQGVIEGARSEAGEGRSFYSFLTIPFAQPPVGDLRFKNPVPPEPWTGVRDGSVATPACPQLPVLPGYSLDGQEDCLFLSVYTPRPYVSDLPVMVWIHGGGFTIGNAGLYEPLPLLTKDIVLVTIQYRLSVLGFLSTEDSEIPGNLGLKDQTMALRWVQENIREFGGDPDQVTIFGESAGAASVHFHILSPMSSGLFRRAILQSGTAIDPWAVRGGQKEVAAQIGKMYNCSESSPLNSSELAACLREVPADELIKAPAEFFEFSQLPQVMTPFVDGEFLPDHPATLLKEGRYNKVDIMAGMTQHEGQLVILSLAGNGTMDNLVENFTVTGPLLAYVEKEDNPVYLARRMFHHYFGPLEGLEQKTDTAIEMFTDRMFRMGLQDLVEHAARDAVFGQRTYAYELQHIGENGLASIFYGTEDNKYASHGDDIQYLFSQKFFNTTLKGEDRFVGDIFVELWTNFAATGNPTPDLSLGFKWEPVTKPGDGYLAITSSPTMKTFDNQEIRHFWKNMPLKANKLLDPERFSSEC
ncbi:cholinesterase 1-like [Penaeus japonicus]|uniref:cholinesterase 1-like n=1 Tax=Penaeus japonicus TaxID=27405 RepID=UPI001C716543|nr:cholinesterase 1-like [Penaeus japonicus]